MAKVHLTRAVLTVMLALASAPGANAQATFHGNPARTGVFAGAGPVKPGGVKWVFETGAPIVASPTLADDVVYIGSLSGGLFAIDARTGKERWTFKSRQGIASSVTIADGSAYLVSSTGALAALDVTTGKARWVFAGEHERRFEAKGLHGYPSAAQTIPDAWDMYVSSPAVVAGKVYFGAGDGNVYAVSAATGILQWKYATRDVVHASPAVAGNTVYVGSFDGRFYALDAETGQPRWVFEGGQDDKVHNQVGFQSSAAVVDGVVYVGCRDAHVYALDAATGRKKWDYPTSKSWVNVTPAVRDGVVYAATSDSSRFMALDAKTGRLRFNFDAKAYVFSSPALAGDLAYFGSHNGKLYAVNAKTGELAWEWQTEGSKHNALKVLNPDGSLNRDAFTPVFGDFGDMYVDFYRFSTLGGFLSSPVVADGVVYIGSLDGKLYAIQ